MLTAALALLTSVAPPLPPAAPAAPTAQLDYVLSEMAVLMYPCVQPTTTTSVFTRCYDLHSSIHAHWAAYRLARADESYAYLAQISYLALEPQKIRHDRPSINYVYAQAWFLLLAIEYERWCLETNQPDPERLVSHARSIAQDMLGHYQAQPPTPGAQEYNNPAWALLQLFRWFEHDDNDADLAATDAIIDQNFYRTIPNHRLGWDITANPGFFSTYCNWVHLMVETQDEDTVRGFMQLQYDPPNPHLFVNDVFLAHTYGLGWSRVWGLRSMARNALTGDDRLRFWRAAEEHIRVGMVRHQELSGDFLTYDHWVPQFAIYAVTEGMGL